MPVITEVLCLDNRQVGVGRSRLTGTALRNKQKSPFTLWLFMKHYLRSVQGSSLVPELEQGHLHVSHIP